MITRICDHPTVQLCFLEDNLFQQTSALALKIQHCNIIGTYVVAINKILVHTLQEVNRTISDAYISDTPEIILTLAPHSYQNLLVDEHLPIIQDN